MMTVVACFRESAYSRNATPLTVPRGHTGKLRYLAQKLLRYCCSRRDASGRVQSRDLGSGRCNRRYASGVDPVARRKTKEK